MKTTGIASDDYFQSFDCLVVGLDDKSRLGYYGAQVDKRLEGWFSRAAERSIIKGSTLELAFLPSPSDEGPAAYLVMGSGDPEKVDRDAAFKFAAAATKRLCDNQRKQVAFAVSDFVPKEMHQDFVAGVIVGSVGQGIHQNKPSLKQPEEFLFLDVSQADVDAGTMLGNAINTTRWLVNQPANIIYPQSFAEHASELAQQFGLEIEVWDKARLEQENCAAMLAVGRASAHEPRLVILKYQGGEKGQPPIALVGKGVTFDSGGLSIKPTDSMTTMKCDMAGAATVVGVMAAIAQAKPAINVIGFCGLVENMIAGDAYRLGDVLKTRSGKTVEIMNTDAEGRVVLADVLDVACDYKPAAIVDLATLTGACVVALGMDVCGLFTNKPELVERIRVAAEVVGEPVWELPMFDFFGEQIRSKVADIKNTGDGRWGGAITAAKFLEEFIRDHDWVHIDIAGPAFAESSKSYRDAGATGVMVRTLVHWLQSEAR